MNEQTRRDTKRRDNKNRILRTGESQKPNGMYTYKYQENGKSKYVYSWRLIITDVTPAGKKDKMCLREQEKLIKANLESGLATQGGNYTVLELIKKYTALRTDVKENTRVHYNYVINLVIKEGRFCKRRIDTIKVSDAKEWLIQLGKDGKSRNTVRNIRGVMKPAFEMAVRDDLIKKNPFAFSLAEVMKNEYEHRDAITKQQEKSFLKFIKNDDYFSEFYEGFYILFHTGLRISEFCALTTTDINLKERCINIDKQLQYRGKYWIDETKTNSGKRMLPIPLNDEELFKCMERLLEKRKKPIKNEPIVDGVQGFLYLSNTGKPLVGYQWAKKFKYAVEKYNSIYKEPLPKITPHVCRHTYCTRQWQRGLNVKTIQALMGHASIEVTMDTYTHATYQDIVNEVNKVSE